MHDALEEAVWDGSSLEDAWEPAWECTPEVQDRAGGSRSSEPLTMAAG